MYSICPICDSVVPSLELERHADSHFKDEDLARDIELAQQIELAYCGPLDVTAQGDNVASLSCETTPQQRRDSGSVRCDGSISSSQGNDVDEKFCYLISLQTRETFYKVEDGLMTLLRNCLMLESENTTSILSGYLDHFQSIESEDVGWGCGWRNIQLLSSHFLNQRQEAREVLFGGSGFVPDISSLQQWLEIAWKRGFDKLGSEHFDHKIYGKRNWIGTPECAALFRSFGLRARIVDFDSEGIISPSSSVLGSNHVARGMDINGSNRTTIKLLGPMDNFLIRGAANNSQAGSSGHKHSDLEKMRGHQVLVDWVWNYFSGNKPYISGTRHVITSEKAPLYFQHDGHSRSIVGIQVKHQKNGMQQFNLLILDPAHRTKDLEKSLKAKFGWQQLIKRGVHTLKKPQYQLIYVDLGIAHGEELDKLKILDSVYYRF